MRRFCFTLGFFLLTAGAETEDSQGYREEQTKATPVTKDVLLKEENAVGHGTETIPTEETAKRSAAAATAKFPGAVLFETTPTAPYETSQITKAAAVIASPAGEPFVSRSGHSSLPSTGDSPSTQRIDGEAQIPSIPNYESIILSSTQTAFESVMNGTSQPEVHLSAGAAGASFWPSMIPHIRNHGGTVAAFAPADGGPGDPVLSASHTRVIDNPAEPRADNYDKRSQGEAEEGVSDLGRKEHVLDTMQSVFQSDTAGDSVAGNTVTGRCLTCTMDRRPTSSEKTSDVSSDSLSTEGFLYDFHQVTASFLPLHRPSYEEQEETLNKDVGKGPSSDVQAQRVYGPTFYPFSSNTTASHTRGISNNSQIESFLSDRGAAVILAEMSPAKQTDSEEQERQAYLSDTSVTKRAIPTTAALYHSSKSPHVENKPEENGEREIFGKKANNRDPLFEIMHLSENNNGASDSLSTNVQTVFIHSRPLDSNSGSVSITPAFSEFLQSSQRSVHPEGTNHNATTARMIEAHSAIVSHSLISPTPAEVLSLTRGTGSLSSALTSQTAAKPSSQTKEATLTFSPQSAITFASPQRHSMVPQAVHTLNTVNSGVKQAAVDPLGRVSKRVLEEAESHAFTQRNVVVPVKSSLSGSSREFNEAFTSTPAELSSKSFAEELTVSRQIDSQSKITQERTSDVSDDKNAPSTHHSLVKYNRDLIVESLIAHNLAAGDKNEQVLTVEAGDGVGEFIRMEGREGEEIKVVRELQEEKDEKSGNKTEELFTSDKAESREHENVINSGGRTNESRDQEEDKVGDREVNTNTQQDGSSIGEDDGALRQNKDQGEVGNEVGAAEKQRGCLNNDGAGAKREEAASQKDAQDNRAIGREGVTNVPPGPPTSSEEHLKNMSSCHTLIKQLQAAELKHVHAQMKNEPFPHIVTRNQRLLPSTLRSQGPEISKMTPAPKEPYTHIKPHPSAHSAALPLAEESPQSKAAAAPFSVAAASKTLTKVSPKDVTSNLGDAMEPTASRRPVSSSVHDALSLTAPRLAITVGLLPARPHFTVNSSTLAASIIYSVSHHRHKFKTSVSKADSLLRTASTSGRAEDFTPAHIFESGVKDPLTLAEMEVNPASSVYLSNISSNVAPTTAAFLSEAHGAVGQLLPQQGKSTQIHRASSSSSSCSSSEMTSGQPCSFKLSEQTAHSDASRAPVDDNEQRSVQSLMASMRPEAKNNQFPLSSTSPPLNLVLLAGDRLPYTYSSTALTRSAPETSRLHSEADTANGGRSEAGSSLAMADEMNHMEEMTTEHSDAVTERTKDNRGEEDISSSAAQAISRGKHAIKADDSDSLSIMQAERRENGRLPNLDDHKETSATPVVFAIREAQKMEQALNKHLARAPNDFFPGGFEENDPTGTTASVGSASLPEIAQTLANDGTDNAASGAEHQTAKPSERPHDSSSPRGAAHVDFRGDLKVPDASTRQPADRVMNAASDVQITATDTSDFVLPPPKPDAFGLIVSTEAHESTQTTGESVSVSVAIQRSPQAARAEYVLKPDSRLELLSPGVTRTTRAVALAVKIDKAKGTKSSEESDHDTSVQTVEQSRHAATDSVAPRLSIRDYVQGGPAELENTARGAGEEEDSTPTMTVENSSFHNIKTTLITKSAFEAKHPQDERTPTVPALDGTHRQKIMLTLSEKTSISQVILRTVTDSAPPAGIFPIINKTSCRTIGCAKPAATSETTTRAAQIDHVSRKEAHITQSGNKEKDHLNAPHNPDTQHVARESTPQASNLANAPLSPAPGKSGHGAAAATTKSTERATRVTSTTTMTPLAETDHLERLGAVEQQQQLVEKRQSHRETSAEAIPTGVTSFEPEATAVQATVKTTERALLTENTPKTQLNRGAAEAEIYEVQNATRSARSPSGGEEASRESGRRQLVPEPASESQQPRQKHRRKTSPHQYLPGVTEVSDDLCGSGNYTAEMTLNLGRGVEPGDAVPATGNLRVVINLKTNNSRLNLEVTSCCLSPTIQPDLSNSTCCLFSRLAAEPAGITLLPSALSTSASFTISLFQMVNYSVVYLHCDLSVCLKNRSDCERQCLQQRSSFPLEDPQAVVTNLRNRISFGPMLKEVKNSTYPEEMDPAELDLVLVVVGLVVGSSVVTVTLLLVWMAYRRRAVWPLRSPAPPRACCGCLHPGGDLILP